MNKLIFTISLLLLFSATVVMAQETDYSLFGIDTKTGPVPKGLQAGDKAPEFSGYDQAGARVNSSKVLESGPIVLFFYQGKWSQIDSKCLNNMQDSLNILTGMGVNVVAVTPESIENVEQTVKLHNLTFTVIYDCQEQIMKDYGLYYNVSKEFSDRILKQYSIDIARNNERAAAHLPVPATYIINRQGIVVAVSFNPDYNTRASVSWIIKNLASAL
jgi:peroxiredoxin